MEYLLYRQITNGDADIFANAVNGVSNLTVRMHCVGGSVFDGIAIANTVNRIANSTCIIEGVAASMGFVIALNFKTIKARKSARLMCHEITANGVSGNAQKMSETAADIENNNNIIAEMIAKRINKTADWVKENWMKPNVNTWFSADEALKLGLIDEIIEDDAVLKNELTSYSNDDLINFYNDFLTKSYSNMEQLNGLLQGIGINDFKGTEQQAVALLATELSNRQTKIEALEAKVQAYHNAELTALMEAKKIPTKQRQTYIDIADKMGMDAAKTVLNGLTSPVVKLEGDGKKERTYAEWEKEDPAGLLEIFRNDPDRYQAILNTY